MVHLFRRRQMVLVLALFGLAASTLYAYDPVPGGEQVDALLSPAMLASGVTTAGTRSVSGDIVNPATSALKQRPHIDASYSAIIGGALQGHAAFGGATIPTPAGVFTGSLGLVAANYDSFAPGTRFRVAASAAKDLYPNLLLGVGIQMHLGSFDSGFRIGAGLDLGAVWLPESVGVFRDPRIGIALQQLGYGYSPAGATTASPAPFTPAIDVSARILETELVDVDFGTGLRFPSFQNVIYRAALSTTIADRVVIDVGWDVDVRAQLGGDADSLLPSGGIVVRFQTSEPQSDIEVQSAVAPLSTSVWAASLGMQAALGVVDREPPVIEVTYPETVYLSPNNDGASDELLLPVAIRDERFVTSWTLQIIDGSGETVRTIENKEQRPENEGLQNIVDRLLYVKRGVDVPDAIRWSGRTDDGTVAPDGRYRFVVTALDDNGNVRSTSEFELEVDGTAPAVTIGEPAAADDLIFSPNGDGNKDTLTIAQEGSPEDLWTLEILDSSDTVVFRTEQEGALGDFTWNGRDAEGAPLPDGVYSYRVSATDRAQNAGAGTLANIIIDTEPTPVSLQIDQSHFSPNGDDVQDTVVFTPGVPVVEGIRSHRFVVRDTTGRSVRTDVGGPTVPVRWVFDGRADDGRVLPEGSYSTRLEIFYRNGNEPVAESPAFVLDVTPPRATVQSDTFVFSPNGDGRLDTVSFLHDTESVLAWTAEVTGPDGVVREWTFEGQPDPRITWDGRSAEGTGVPDGEYRYVLEGVDRAGNRVRTRAIGVLLDTRETPVFVSSDRAAFSPNADAAVDSLALLPDIADPRGIERFELAIQDDRGRTVRRITSAGTPNAQYDWDGRGTSGVVVPDGSYTAQLTADYEHGNRAVARSAPFVVDTAPPSVAVSVSDTIFSPDGDGLQDSIEIVQSSSSETRWFGAIEPADGDTDPVRTWEFSGELRSFEWDGTGNDGSVVPDGEYRYVVTATDAAGNSTSARSAPFRTDTRELEIELRISETAISPNRDGVQDSVMITPVSTIGGVAEWTLNLLDANEEIVVTRRGTTELPQFEWDGNTATGQAPDGVYRAELQVRYERGDIVTVRSARTITVDRVAPTATVSLNETIMSPNGDGFRDAIVVSQETSREERWTARIIDADGNDVWRREWIGTADATVELAGLDDERRRLPDGGYAYVIEATDLAGNVGVSEPQAFEIYTAETPVALYRNVAAFSPNDDGALDDVVIRTEIGPARGLEAYRFTITAANGATVVERTGDRPPSEFTWDGTVDDGDGRGRTAPEGVYRAEIELRYRHGNRPTARSEAFVLDVTAPRLALGSNLAVFSPDGDGRSDAVEIAQSGEGAETWTAAITPTAGGDPLRTWTFTDAPQNIVWDGTDTAGNRVPDGDYTYAISAADAAGNGVRGQLSPLTVDTRSAQTFMTLDRRLFSPNGDGFEDQVTFGLITSRTDGATGRILEILNRDGRVVRRFASEAVQGRDAIVWDGRDQSGRIVDGVFSARAQVFFTNGAQPEAVSPEFVLDTRGPTVAVTLDGLPFSPDNDGVNDELTIRLQVNDENGIASWRFEILDRNRRPFQSWDGTGSPRRTLTWDGRSNRGDLVISAEDYPWNLVVRDTAGNETRSSGLIPIDILVVRDGDRLRVQISNINFQPNSPELELDSSTDQGAKNVEVLDRLVEVFDKYATYAIRIEGHAVNVTGTEREEREELQPLSLARAERVRDALVSRGMDPARIDVLGRGGTDPIVPHTDLDERWKNRRVEFILLR